MARSGNPKNQQADSSGEEMAPQSEEKTREGVEASAEEGIDRSQVVTIDGKDYTLESLGEEGREQLNNLNVTDQELGRLRSQQAIAQTARNTYARILARVLEGVEPVR